MVTWVYIALAAHFLNAIAFVLDKYLLTTSVLRPFAYAFWVAILSSVVVVLIPAGIFLPDWFFLVNSFISGGTFFFALIFLYRAIQKTDVSIASTKVSSLSVAFAYLFSIFILGDSFSVNKLLAFGLVVTGVILLGKVGKRVWREAFLAGMLFGISLVTLKLSFDLSDFVNGFFWTRIGFVVTALAMLVLPSARKEVAYSFKASRASSKFIFLFSKGIAGTGFVLLDVAIRLGNVALVNALLGVQFVLIFALSFIFGRKIPALAEDDSGDLSIFVGNVLGFFR